MQIVDRPPNNRLKGARQLCWVDLAQVTPNPYQPRRMFSEQSIAELAESIRQYGLLSPIVVRRMGINDFELIAGERRLRALRKLGQTHADAIVLPAFEQDSALIALIENLQREDLHYFEEAEAYHMLVREHGLTQDELARRLGRSPSSVANRLRLLRLTADTRTRLIEASMSERHARALLRLPDERLQRQALEQAIAAKMSVKQLETLIEQWIRSGKQAENPASRRKVRMIYRDHRMFVNALMDTVRAIEQTGIGVTSRIIEKDSCVEILVTIPRGCSTGRVPIPDVSHDKEGGLLPC